MGRGDLLRQIQEARRQKDRESVEERFQKFFPNGFSTLPTGFVFRSSDPLGYNVSVEPSASGAELLVRLDAPETDRRLRRRTRVDRYTLDRFGRMRNLEEVKIGPLDEERLLAEIVDRAEAMALPDWRFTGIDLNPKGEADGDVIPGVPSEPREDEGEEFDNERLKVLLKMPGLLAHMVNKKFGLSGYRLYLFPGGCVLESPLVRNAAYVVLFDGQIRQTKRDIRTMDQNAVDRMIASMPGSEFISASKGDKRAEAAKGTGRVRRIIHVGEWQDRVREAAALIQDKREGN